jgi:hypothetical protein
VLRVTATRKFTLTAAMFALALALVGLAAATHVVAPLFAAWAPLLTVPYVLTRPEPGEIGSKPPSEGEAGTGPSLGGDQGETEGTGAG